MSKLLKSIVFLFGIALIIAGINHVWTYQQHYDDNTPIKPTITAHGNYKITPIKASTEHIIETPILPDISGYTLDAMKGLLPEVKGGAAVTMPLNKGFRFERGGMDVFAIKQNVLEPKSIVIQEGVYDLQTLVDTINDETLIQKRDNDTYVLYVPLSVRTGASLVISNNETLLMSANTGAILSSFGSTHIVNASVIGWDTVTNEPAFYKDEDTFRPYIVAWCGATLNIAGSKIAHLGYNSSKAYGLTYTSCTDTLYREDYLDVPGGTGTIVDNHFSDMYFAFYCYEADDIAIIRNIYEDNIVYGIDPHDRSENLIIAHNEARGTKEKHGIIISREVNNSFIFNNLSEDNNGSGIMIDRQSTGNIIAFNTAQNNKGDGLTFYESPDNLSYQNILVNNQNSGLRIRNSWNVVSYKDMLNYNDRAGVRLYTADLIENESTKHRDPEYDPFTENAEVKLYYPEMIGNVNAHFKLTDVDHVEIVSPTFFKSPNRMFLGDLMHMNGKYLDLLAEPGHGIDVRKVGKEGL